MHTIRRRALRHWLISLLVGLLVLAPYLHSHVGASAQTGLHLAAMHTLTVDASDTAQNDESPAVGVSPSLPQVGVDLLGLVACVRVLGLLLPRVGAHPAWPQLPRLAQTIYALGWPPPSLAPPRA